jgi:hypothetical protein
LLAQLLLKYS